MGKKVFSVTIEENTFEKWKEYVEKKCINSSKLIEKMLIEYLKKEGGK